jgi:hypothetical protein
VSASSAQPIASINALQVRTPALRRSTLSLAKASSMEQLAICAFDEFPDPPTLVSGEEFDQGVQYTALSSEKAQGGRHYAIDGMDRKRSG